MGSNDHIPVPDPKPKRTSENKSQEWEVAWVEAYIWWCGDDICNCTQSMICRVTPNLVAGYPWIKRHRLWEGEFFSGADAQEAATQQAELRDAARKYGIDLDDNLYGRRRNGQ